MATSSGISSHEVRGYESATGGTHSHCLRQHDRSANAPAGTSRDPVAHTAVTTGQHGSTILPIPPSTLRHLPSGTFYILAGQTISSATLWQASAKGGERQLTQLVNGSGISWMGASSAGIVVAAPSQSGGFTVPVLGKVTAAGLSLRPHVLAASPDIDTGGQIVDAVPGRSGQFDLTIRRSYRSGARIAYRLRHPPGGPVWGPHHLIAISSSMHPPDTTGPRSRLLVINTHGSARVKRTDFREISDVVWDPSAPAIAVANWSGAGELIWLNGRREKLPAGWTPASWNAAGSELLVESGPINHPRKLGVWSRKHPTRVFVIGRLPTQLTIAQLSWVDSTKGM
jgi:hypothetical protein